VSRVPSIPSRDPTFPRSVSPSVQTLGPANSNRKAFLCVRTGRGHTSLELRNRLLASLQTEDLILFERHLREVPIEQGEMLEEPGRFVDAVYFPQNGMISLIVQMPEDCSVDGLLRRFVERTSGL
jgi:hypothetical protein